MKRALLKVKKVVYSSLMVLSVFASCLYTNTSYAASTTKAYTISTENTPVYKTSNLSGSKYGTIYSSDELLIHEVTKSYCKVEYPL